MPDLFTTEERAELEALAYARGFGSLREYLQMLVQQDVSQTDSDEDSFGRPSESFQRAWEDASDRRTMSWDEFLRRLGE